MIMKRWRVGSLSMGIILVASGILLMVSLIIKVSVLNILLTFWPIILICLGLEILLHLFFKKEDGTNVKIKYDVLSVFFIGFVLMISFLFYVASFSVELLGGRDDTFAILGIKHEDVHIESTVELAGANELVVFAEYMSIKVVHTTDENIRVDYRIATQTNDKEYAISMLENTFRFENGERAYMMVNTSVFSNYRRIGHPTIDCIIFLPQNSFLDISQYHGRIEYDAILESQLIRPSGFYQEDLL